MREKRLQVRTHYIHRINYSTQEKLVGFFVFIAVSILVWLLFASGKNIIDTESYYTLYGELKTIQPVDNNTKVIIGGLNSGRVTTVDLTEDNKIIISMEILKRYKKLIRTDSVARLNTFNIGMINQSFIEISIGSSDKPLLKKGDTIHIKETIDMRNLVINLINTIENISETSSHVNSLVSEISPGEIKTLITDINIITSNIINISNDIKGGKGVPVSINSLDKLVSNVNFNDIEKAGKNINNILAAIDPQLVNELLLNLLTTTHGLNDISQQIQSGKGVIGSSIYNKKTREDFEKTLANLNNASIQLNHLLILLNKELKQMPDLINKIEPLISEADKTIKATQKIWPVSSTIEDDKDKNLLTSPEFIND
jgi:ABC-type transporter Mla subunit MlaD